MSWYIVTVEAIPMAGVALTMPGCVFSEECSNQGGAEHSVILGHDELEAIRRSSIRIMRTERIPDHVVAAIRKSAG
jgi:hypothetical protein